MKINLLKPWIGKPKAIPLPRLPRLWRHPAAIRTILFAEATSQDPSRNVVGCGCLCPPLPLPLSSLRQPSPRHSVQLPPRRRHPPLSVPLPCLTGPRPHRFLLHDARHSKRHRPGPSTEPCLRRRHGPATNRSSCPRQGPPIPLPPAAASVATRPRPGCHVAKVTEDHLQPPCNLI